MDTPEISVIVPTFNRPELLREALASVIAQKGVSFEIVVVNDAGSDVLELVNQLSEHVTLKYIRHPSNRGLPAARNTGILHSAGRLIAYLDDDDLYMDGHLVSLAERLSQNPEAALVYSDAILERELVDGEGEITYSRRVLAQEYERAVMLNDSFICPSSMMHRRECVDVVGGFDEEMRWCYEDWDFLLKMDTRYSIERVPGATVTVRLRNNGSNMSSTVNPFRRSAALKLMERYGCGPIQPKTFWEVADSLEQIPSL